MTSSFLLLKIFIWLKFAIYSLSRLQSEHIKFGLNLLLVDLSIFQSDYTKIEHHFPNPTKRSPPTAHNSPITYGNCMKKIKSTQLNGKYSDRPTADSNQTLCANYVTYKDLGVLPNVNFFPINVHQFLLQVSWFTKQKIILF